MKFYVVGLVCLAAWGCRNRQEMIAGSWKIDSVYTYYNGYGTMESDSLDLERYTYEPTGDLRVSWLGTSRAMTYSLTGSDSLLYFENGREVARFQVVSMNQKQLILRKSKPPLFKGKGQERYEVRYFSRVE